MLGPRAGEPARPEPVRPAPAAIALTNVSVKPLPRRVLFLCIGNSCRSQMAEAFAMKYGADAIIARSAGLAPAVIIAPLTHQILAERNIQLTGHFPKMLDMTNRDANDLLINISGESVSLRGAQVIDWDVDDPIGLDEEFFRKVADQIENLVMRLILDIRNGSL